MKNQITKETVYRIPADVKRESAVTLQEKHLLQKFTNILREDGKNYWFNAERFLRTAEEYNFTVSSMMRDIELSEYVEEEESNETIPQKLAKTDPKKVLAAGGIVLVILILLVYLIVRRSGKKRVSGEKEEAEKSGKEN